MVLACFPIIPGNPPPAPEHFDARYQPPPHVEYPSDIANAHPRDQRLSFLRGPHVYLDGDTPVSETSTGAGTWCCSDFDPDDAIRKMKGGKTQRYPRRDLTIGLRQISSCDEFDCTLGCMIVVGDMTASVLQPRALSDATGKEVFTKLSELMIDKYRGQLAEAKYFVFERGMADDEIKAMWNADGEEARNRGTEAHLQMQYVAEGYPHRDDDPEVVIGKRFLAEIPDGWAVHRTEWKILADEEDLAGSVDLLIHNRQTGKARIYDYKRASKLPDKLHGYGKQKPPFQHLDDCDGAKYAMQLSLYQYMLAKYYGLVIEDRVLMSIHPDRPFLTSVPYLKDEVEHYMAVRRRLVQARAKVIHRCPLTGVALHDPVVIEGGQVVDRKAALVRGMTIVQDTEPDVKALVEQEIQEHLEGPEPQLGDVKPWFRLMPRQGITPRFRRDPKGGL